MEKKFSIVKRKDLLTNEEKAYGFILGDDEKAKQQALKKISRSLQGIEKDLSSFRVDETMSMHLLPGLSKQCVQELSRHIFNTAYAVCRKKGQSEEVLYLALLKDTALQYKASLPGAVKKINSHELADPAYYVKELRLCL